jgi:hypothetical protein
MAVIIFDDNGNVSFDSFYKEKGRWKFNSVVSQNFSLQSVNGNTIVTGTADNSDMKYICFIDTMSGLNGTLPTKVSDSLNSKFDQFKLKSYKGSTVYNSTFIKRNNDNYFLTINSEKVKIN